MSDKDMSEDRDAEPVDAEFEPAPDDGAAETAEPAGKPRSGGGARLVLAAFAAALIGGASGFVLSRYVPPAAVPGGELTDIQARIDALESRTAPGVSALSERVDELQSTVQARDGLQARIEALAGEIETLRAGASQGGDGGAAMAELETRLAEAFEQIRSRLQALEEGLEAARSDADAARSAAQQANSALSNISAGDSEGGAPPDQRIAALSGRVDALGEAVGEVRDSLAPLQELPARVEAVSQGGGTDAASQQALAELQNRVDALAQQVSSLSGAPAAATPEPAGLAARALAFAALSEATASSQPFAVELEALARVWPSAPGLEPLRAVAREGAPTADRLEDSFPAEALRQATGETRTYFGVLRVARDDEAGPAAAIEAALADDDLAEAGRVVGELSPEALDALGDWREGLAARLQVHRALTQQSAALAAAGDRE